MNSDVFIVIPMYNEVHVIKDVVSNLSSHYKNIVIVDDSSTDGSADVLKDSGVIILRHVVNLGQGAAIQTGITYSITKGAQYIVTFDSDGQHQVQDIDKLLLPLRSKSYDVALGSRFLGEAVNIPKIRLYLIKIAVWVDRFIYKYSFTDTHNGLRAFTASAARKICITQNRMAHASQILRQIHEQHLKFVEVPITIIYSAYSLNKGQSNSNALNIIIELLEEKLFK